MKKLYRIIFVLLIVLVAAGCGEKVNKFSDEELQEIHTKEAELKNQLIGKTWHYYDEPQRAVEFFEDGTRIEYFSAGVRGADIFDDEGDSWDVKFCGFLDADTKYLDEENNSHPVVMGCYGIGIERIIAAIVEQNHDEKGIIWPINIAPFKVSIVQISDKDEKQIEVANKLYEELTRFSSENGKFGAPNGYHDDRVMALSFLTPAISQFSLFSDEYTVVFV